MAEEQAAVLYEKAAELRVDDYQALMFAATCYRGIGRTDAARVASEKGIAAAERALAINAGESRALSLGASELYELGETAKAEEWARRAVQSNPTDPLMLYNIGCLQALMGNSGLALDHLEQAIELGMRNNDWMMTDPDLVSIRDDPRFVALLSQVRSNA
jgi:adenylate cyclase